LLIIIIIMEQHKNTHPSSSSFSSRFKSFAFPFNFVLHHHAFCFSLAPDLAVFAGFVRVLVVFVRIRFSATTISLVGILGFWY
jgi:hypothetical protein